MSAMPDSKLANPEQLIADLQRQLAECRAERDEALAQQTATAEVLQVIIPRPATLRRYSTQSWRRRTRFAVPQWAAWRFSTASSFGS